MRLHEGLGDAKKLSVRPADCLDVSPCFLGGAEITRWPCLGFPSACCPPSCALLSLVMLHQLQLLQPCPVWICFAAKPLLPQKEMFGRQMLLLVGAYSCRHARWGSARGPGLQAGQVLCRQKLVNLHRLRRSSSDLWCLRMCRKLFHPPPVDPEPWQPLGWAQGGKGGGR